MLSQRGPLSTQAQPAWAWSLPLWPWPLYPTLVPPGPYPPPCPITPSSCRPPVAPVLSLPVHLGVEVHIVQHHDVRPCKVQALHHSEV